MKVEEGLIKKEGSIDLRSKNLDGKINGLSEKGIISQRNAVILHELRFLGNKAVHELSCPRKQELKLAIEIIENTLENCYEIPVKGQLLKKNRTNS